MKLITACFLAYLVFCCLPLPVHAQEQIAEKLDKLKLSTLNFVDTTLLDAVSYIQKKSVEIDPEKQGVNIVILSPGLRNKQITLRLKNTTLNDAIRYTTMLAGARMNTTRFAVTISDRNLNKDEPVERNTKSMEAKLSNIILPSVEFNDTPLIDALDFLVSKSGEIDHNGGVNIIYRGERDSCGKEPVTLRLSNIPLRETLKYTAQMSSHSFVIEPNAIVVSR